jgi:O-antigen/teichoic acid export membrane protein
MRQRLSEQIRDFTRRPFVRNVTTVASGTAASQAVAMAFAPIITRLYGPEIFGLQGIFMSVVGLLVTVAAFNYPIAIVLPKLDADALGLARLSIMIAIVMALLVTLTLYVFGTDLLQLINAEAITDFIYLIPIAMLLSVLGSVLGQWLIRKKAFAFSAKYGVFTSLILNSSKAILGIFYPSAMVLIVTNTVGGFVGTGLTWLHWRKQSANHESVPATAPSATLRQLAIRHRDFPLLRTPQTLINALSQSMPILLLAGYFGASASGQYAIAIVVLGMPSGLIGGSVMSVFYPRINEAIRNGENARNLIIKATIGMAATGAIPFLIVIATGPFLFEFVFGEQWKTAGIYAQWLAPWLFFQYVNKPAVSAIPALRLQGGLLAYEIFSTGTKVLALWLGFFIFKSDIAAIALFSIFGVIAYVWLILWVINRSGKEKSNEHTQTS